MEQFRQLLEQHNLWRKEEHGARPRQRAGAPTLAEAARTCGRRGAGASGPASGAPAATPAVECWQPRLPRRKHSRPKPPGSGGWAPPARIAAASAHPPARRLARSPSGRANP